MATPGTKKKKEKIVAALISDTFTTALEPMTSNTPQLLLPIANTPLIDYILESLVVNNIDEVVIFAYSGYSELSHHVKTVTTASGKPWSQSKEVKVDLVDCSKNKSSIRSLTELLADIRGKNKLSGNFILLPCDSVSNLRNIKELYHNHVVRMENDRNAVLTVVAAQNTAAMEAAHHRVTMGAWDRQNLANHTTSPTHAPPGAGFDSQGPLMSPGAMNPRTNSIGSFNFDFNSTVNDDGALRDGEQQHTSRFSVVLDATRPDSVGNMALVYHGWDDSRNLGELVLGDFVMKKKVFSIRTDLINTGVYICNTEMMTILNAAAQEQTMSDLLRHVSDNHEVVNQRFAVAIAPANTTVGYINSASAYVATNVLAVQRHFFPLTRENNFADAQPNYLVARTDPSIFLFERRFAGQGNKEATDTRIGSNFVGPDVVVGLHTVVPSSSHVARTVLGRHVTIGKNVHLFGCVIMNDVVIGAGCNLTNCVVGSNCHIAPGTTICDGSLIGNNVTIAGEGNVMIPGGTRIMCPIPSMGSSGNSPSSSGAAPSSGLAATAKGRGVLWTAPAGSHQGGEGVPVLDELFSQDNIYREGDSDCDGDNGGFGGGQGEAEDVRLKDQQNFLDGVTGTLEKVLTEDMGVENMMSGLKFTMLTYHRVRIDLAAAVLTVTMKLCLADCAKNGITKSKDVCAAVVKTLKRVAPVFTVASLEDVDEDAMRSRSGVNPVLEAFAEAVYNADVTTVDEETGEKKTKNLLRKKADTILSFLFWEVDEQLFQDQGYCTVSEKSLISFDDWVGDLWEEVREEKGEEATLDDMDPVDRAIASGWDCVFEYLEKIRDERKARKKADKKKKKAAEEAAAAA